MVERLRRFSDGIAALCLVLLALPLVHWAGRPLGAGDVFWQVRAGDLALATGRPPSVDSFSYTIAGQPWNNHEWLWEIGVALLHRVAGWGGLRVAVLLLAAACTVGIARTVARRAGAGWALLVVVAWLAWARYKLMPAPQALSMALFLVGLRLFAGARLLDSRRRLAALALFLLAWGNLTAEAVSFVPFVLLGPIALHFERRRRGERGLDRVGALLLAVACVAPLVNPPWSSALAYALRGTAHNREVNSEFAHIWETAGALTPLSRHVAIAVIAVYLPWSALVLARSRERWAALRRVGPGLLACVAAALFERDLWLLVLPLARLGVAARTVATGGRRLAVTAAALVGALGLFVAYARAIAWSPRDAIAALGSADFRREHLSYHELPLACLGPLATVPDGTRVFTLRLWADYLVWAAPRARVFVDGRNLEYPVELHRAVREVWTGGPAALAILDATKTQLVLAGPEWGDLDGIRGGPWRRLLHAEHCALYARAP